MSGQLGTFRVCAVEDLYLPLDYGAFQEPSEVKTGQDANGPACLHLAEVVLFPDPWDLANPFSVKLADLW